METTSLRQLKGNYYVSYNCFPGERESRGEQLAENNRHGNHLLAVTERESREDRGNGLTNDNDRHGNHLLANDEKRRDREDDGPD